MPALHEHYLPESFLGLGALEIHNPCALPGAILEKLHVSPADPWEAIHALPRELLGTLHDSAEDIWEAFHALLQAIHEKPHDCPEDFGGAFHALLLELLEKLHRPPGDSHLVDDGATPARPRNMFAGV